jgi:DNA-directed RNA polymerase subunit RPC12/RpoP
MKSILNTTKYICYRCGRYGPTEAHHIFGSYNRKKSTEDGLIVYLCHSCHNEPPNGAHFSKETREWLHKVGQETYEGRKIQMGMSPSEARESFMERYGKNYL